MTDIIRIVDIEVVEVRKEQPSKYLLRNNKAKSTLFLLIFCIFFAVAFPLFPLVLGLVVITDPAAVVLCISLCHYKRKHYNFEHKFRVYTYE